MSTEKKKLKVGDIVTGKRGTLKYKEWIIGEMDWFDDIYLVRNKGYSKEKYYNCDGNLNDWANDRSVETYLLSKKFSNDLIKIKEGEIEPPEVKETILAKDMIAFIFIFLLMISIIGFFIMYIRIIFKI